MLDPVAGGVSRFAWMLVNPEQPEKQPSPKLVTELGIVVFLQPLNIVFVAVSMMALQFSRES